MPRSFSSLRVAAAPMHLVPMPAPATAPAPALAAWATKEKMIDVAMDVIEFALNHPILTAAALSSVYCSTEVGAKLIKASACALIGAFGGMWGGFYIGFPASLIFAQDSEIPERIIIPLSHYIGPAIGATAAAAYALR